MTTLIANPIEYLNPQSLPTPSGHFSQVAIIDMQPTNKLVFLSGQLGVPPSGIVSNNPEQEAKDLWDNVENALAAAGLPLRAIVKVTQYVAYGTAALPLANARTAKLGEVRPASTLVYVAALARPTYHYEVDVIAAG